MDGDRFDALTRALAGMANRRRLFKGVALALGSIAPVARARVTLAVATCGIACASDADCAASEDNCFACCNGVCISTLDDVNNCNACGNVCPGAPNAVCSRGNCFLHCPAGLTACGDNSFCADLSSDLNNCQACGNACTAPSDACCPAGCVWLEQDDLSCGACGVACGAGLNCCASECVDLRSDVGSCGACGNACAAGQVCNGSACAARCPAGQLFCDPDCVDPQTDAGNCGGCGVACGSGQTCQGGGCASVCPASRTICGGTCVDLANDAGNCGACGTICDGVQRCQGGTCVSTCAAGTTDCGSVCADLASDRNNCGACGTACSRDTGCVNGACIRPQCPKGQTQCQDGCVDVTTDGAHCGGCTNACVAGTSCCGGACVDLKTDPTHCGRCDLACPPGYTCDGKGCVYVASGIGDAGGMRTASPDLCVTKARTQVEIAALLGGAAAPSPKPSWKQIGKGVKLKVKPAPAKLTQTIVDAVVQVSACGSANDPARQTALMTDQMAGRWLAEHGFTGDLLAAVGQTTLIALPPQSWERIATVDQVFTLGTDLVSALVAYEPLSPSIPPRVEIQLFAKHAGGWRLAAIRREDQFTAKTGSLLVRLFDCSAGVSAFDPAGACAPAPELEFAYAIASADGTVHKSLADAEFLDAGLLRWKDLPPGTYGVTDAAPSGIGVTTVIAGHDAIAGDPLSFIVPAGLAGTAVDVFHERTLSSAILRHLQIDAHCGPCSREDPDRAICVPTCPPCSTCQTVVLGVNKRAFSSCRSSCRADQVCQADWLGLASGPAQCCVPTGGACSGDRDCCEGACGGGVCGCAAQGSVCRSQEACCLGTQCQGSPLTCAACKSLGAACAANAECCSGGCHAGVCRCCANDNRGASTIPLCCVYPNAYLRVEASVHGPGFERCCVPGVDCLDDPAGPPASGDVPYVYGLPFVCRV